MTTALHLKTVIVTTILVKKHKPKGGVYQNSPPHLDLMNVHKHVLAVN